MIRLVPAESVRSGRALRLLPHVADETPAASIERDEQRRRSARCTRDGRSKRGDGEIRRGERDRQWQAWMVAAQAGDAAAYEALLIGISAYARARLCAWAETAARDEILQNALLRLHRARHTYRCERPFTPWLDAILRNAAIDWIRSYRARAKREVALESSDASAAPIAYSPAHATELVQELARALAALPAKQREAVEWLHLEGLTVAEAAARAGATPGALKVRASRGYRRLRQLLGVPTRSRNLGGPNRGLPELASPNESTDA
jgi:RNA polymerase sigma-70 factor (ECF subfamily)